MSAPAWLNGRVPARSRKCLTVACFVTVAVLLLLGTSLFLQAPGQIFPLGKTHARPSAPPSPSVSLDYTIKTPPQYTRAPYASYKLGSHWPSWEGLETIFIIGDSWATLGFDPEGEQPTPANPFGNPPWSLETWHQTNAENWVRYITVVQNSSFVRTVNLAYGGATVDVDLISPDAINLKGLKYQLREWFKPNYVAKPDYFPWNTDTTLFIVWIGLNDIHNADEESSMLFGKCFEEYAIFMDELYHTGVRNFLFMNIPPIHRSPLALKIETVDAWRGWVHAWNQNITNMAANLTEHYSDATVFVFDTYKLFDEVIDDPCSHDITCRFKDTTTFCWAYAFSTQTPEIALEDCPYPANEYLWMNDLHPTSSMHNLTAHEIASALSTGEKSAVVAA